MEIRTVTGLAAALAALEAGSGAVVCTVEAPEVAYAAREAVNWPRVEAMGYPAVCLDYAGSTTLVYPGDRTVLIPGGEGYALAGEIGARLAARLGGEAVVTEEDVCIPARLGDGVTVPAARVLMWCRAQHGGRPLAVFHAALQRDLTRVRESALVSARGLGAIPGGLSARGVTAAEAEEAIRGVLEVAENG